MKTTETLETLRRERDEARASVAWIRSIVQQCQAAGVPVFVKQLGSKPEGRYFVDGRHEPHPWNPANGKWSNPDEWPIDLRARQFPEAANA